MDDRPAGSRDPPDGEEERGAIGENFCHPPPLPPSLPDIELPELPGLFPEFIFELLRISEDWFGRWNPPFEFPPNAPFALPPNAEGCDIPPELFNPPGEPIALAPGIELPPMPPARPPARVTPGSP